jgi:hypothetical protein
MSMARHERRHFRRRSVRDRIARFFRAIFSSRPSWPPDDPRWDSPEGGVGVREPRRPLLPHLSGSVALEPPPDDRRDVWAVGSES